MNSASVNVDVSVSLWCFALESGEQKRNLHGPESEASTVKLGEEQRWRCLEFQFVLWFGVLLLLPPAGLLINSNP